MVFEIGIFPQQNVLVVSLGKFYCDFNGNFLRKCFGFGRFSQLLIFRLSCLTSKCRKFPLCLCKHLVVNDRFLLKILNLNQICNSTLCGSIFNKSCNQIHLYLKRRFNWINAYWRMAVIIFVIYRIEITCDEAMQKQLFPAGQLENYELVEVNQ